MINDCFPPVYAVPRSCDENRAQSCVNRRARNASGAEMQCNAFKNKQDLNKCVFSWYTRGSRGDDDDGISVVRRSVVPVRMISHTLFYCQASQ